LIGQCTRYFEDIEEAPN